MAHRITFTPLALPDEGRKPDEDEQVNPDVAVVKSDTPFPPIDIEIPTNLNINEPDTFLNLGVSTLVAGINGDISRSDVRLMLNAVRTLSAERRNVMSSRRRFFDGSPRTEPKR
jgi:hypothetical protein